MRQDFNGWDASATFKLVPQVGAEADFAGGYDPTYHSLGTVMGGPQLSANNSGVGLYGHALFGALTFNGGVQPGTASSIAFVLGGGADLWFSRHLGARLIQFDYLRNNNQAAVLGFEHSSSLTGPGNCYRIAAGIVFRFGH